MSQRGVSHSFRVCNCLNSVLLVFSSFNATSRGLADPSSLILPSRNILVISDSRSMFSVSPIDFSISMLCLCFSSLSWDLCSG